MTLIDRTEELRNTVTEAQEGLRKAMIDSAIKQSPSWRHFDEVDARLMEAIVYLDMAMEALMAGR